MSNATTLQTNNNKLSTNNTDLASILNTINNLPEAGGGSGGGSVETCSVDFWHCFMLGGIGWVFKHLVTYTKLVDGEITTVSEIYNGMEFSLSDVVVGSNITLINVGNLEATENWRYKYMLDNYNSNSNIVYDGDADVYAIIVQITGDEEFDLGGFKIT